MRQGDVMSAYIFVLVMEYLARIMKKVGKLSGFSYHPRCSKLGIVNVTFADDLLLLCRADVTSIRYLRAGLNHFVEVFNFEINASKIPMFFGGCCQWRRGKNLQD